MDKLKTNENCYGEKNRNNDNRKIIYGSEYKSSELKKAAANWSLLDDVINCLQPRLFFIVPRYILM